MRALALLGTATLLFVAGCSLNTDYFSDYRGKNILGNSGFAVAGKWALTANTNTSDPAYNPTPANFMNWAAASDLGAQGLTTGPDGSAAYRLEIMNLIPDGDFEAGGDTGTGFAESFWAYNQSSGPGSTDIAWNTTGVDGNSVPMSINNNTLAFGNLSNIDQLTLTLSNAVSAALWARGGSYQFRFDFYNGSALATLPLTFTTPTSTANWNQVNLAQGFSSVTTQYHASEFFTVGASPTGTYTVTINNTSNNFLGYFDNVRMMNAAIDPTVLLSFSSLSSGTAQLLPGTKAGAYTMSVYVHDDPTAVQGAANHSPNRFNPSGLTITVTAAVKSGTGTYQQFFPRPSTGWTSWTQLTMNMGFDFVDTDSQLGGSPALTVKLSPTNTVDESTNGRDVGSILVAEPVLLYNP
jgi:hypothetical protein